MIILDVEEYCHECPEFEASVGTNACRNGLNEIIKVNHTIRCSHRHRCAAIKKHIIKENKNA